MKSNAEFSIPCSLIALWIVLCCQTNASAQDELSQIRHAIVARDAKWEASENWLTRLSQNEQRRLLGAPSIPPSLARTRLLTIPLIPNLPSKFDWRNNNGNWVTPPKNQNIPKSCGSCWAFATIGQVESWWKIHNTNPDSIIDLSEQCLLSCSSAGSCDGGDLLLEMNFLTSVGVCSEACLGYQADAGVPCVAACSNWRDNAVKIPGWGFITRDEAILENIKSAVFRHPVQAGFDVYQDFVSYSSGIYSHVWGNYLGGHEILVVGWDDQEKCWICKNSWGTEWGETVNSTPRTPGAGNGGYFRIKYGECDIGSWVVQIWDEMAAGESFAYAPTRIDTALTVGDTLSRTVVLSNAGPRVLEFSAMDYQSPVVAWFRPADFNAYSGQSWWCGDPAAGGYKNYWLQYLDLPVLNLSHAGTPKLTFMGYWAVESPMYALPPFDGWDGCNVWISVDGGKSFDVAHPLSPAYSCSSLYSFGSCGDGWGMGPGIAGWGGKSNAWKAVEIDLSPYKADSVIIRYAFASDAQFCSLDDQTLYGFFVDDIEVVDGSTVLFENHGAADSAMRTRGNAGWEKADWLTFSPGAGTIQPWSAFVSDLSITTAGLSSGRYSCVVVFNTNDSMYVPMFSASGLLTVEFDLGPATSVQERSAEVPAHWVLRQNYPNPFNSGTIMKYELPKSSEVRLSVYDLLGREVSVLVKERRDAGVHQVKFNASGLASGMYIYRLQAGSFVQSRKLMLLK